MCMYMCVCDELVIGVSRYVCVYMLHVCTVPACVYLHRFNFGMPGVLLLHTSVCFMCIHVCVHTYIHTYVGVCMYWFLYDDVM